MKTMNLFMADVRCAKKSKILLTVLCVALGVSLLFILFIKLVDYLVGPTDPTNGGFHMDYGKMALGFILSANTFVFITAIGISVFSGSEFAYNTVRNRIISGNSRTKIWFSQFLTNLTIFFAMYFTVAIFSTGLCALLFGFSDFGGIMARLALSLPLYVSMVAIMTFIITGTKFLPSAIIINLLILMLVPQFLGIILMLIPNQTWVAVLETNPYTMLSKVWGSDMISLLSDGLTGKAASLDPVKDVLKSILVAVCYGGLAIGGGVLSFNRTDIK